MNLRQFLLIIRLRWPLVLLCTVAVSAAVAVIALRQPKVYTSQTSLLLDLKADPLVATFMPSMASPAFFATQAHIIKSDKVASAVVKRLGLERSKEAAARWRAETGGKVPLETYFSNMMQRGLTVEPAAGTNVLNVSFTAADPRFAAVVANAYAQAYIDFSVDLRVDPARQYATWFDAQLKTLRADLEEAQSRLSAAQQQNGIISADGSMDEDSSKLSALLQQQATLQIERAESMVRARNSGQVTSPDIQDNGAVQNLRARLAKIESSFSEIKNKYGESHPEYQLIQTQLLDAQSQLARELRLANAASNNANQASEQKIAELGELIKAQKQKVLGLRGGRDGLEILVKDVETAQRAYEAVANRRSQLFLESRSEQAAARILSVAVEALSPSSRTHIHIMLGIIGGLGLGFAAAVGLELLDRRIRSTDDLLAIDNVPVLAVMGAQGPSQLRVQYPRRSRLGSEALKLLGIGKN